jgi:serine/threonine protein kinase
VASSLGTAGQADVFRVLHQTQNREVVLEWAREPLGGGPEAVERWLTRARALTRLRHPHLVSVHDGGVFEGRPYLVRDFCRGTPLEQHTRIQPCSPREAAALVARLARAVALLHRHGVVHQQVSPRGIVLAEAGQPRLGEFALGPVRPPPEDEASSRDSGMTLVWLAPEQVCGEDSGIGPAVDVFGLGGVLYFLLTGRSPYPQGGGPELLRRCREGAWDRDALRAPEVPAKLAAVCARALDPRPDNRHASADALAGELERFVRPWSGTPLLLAGLLGVLGLAVLGWLNGCGL